MPFPESSAIWKEQEITIAGPIFSHNAICGDTLLNGTHYSQVLGLQVDNDQNITGSYFKGGLRVSGDEVFFRAYSGQEVLLYDFNLEANDVINVAEVFLGNTVSRTVDSVKTEMLADKMRKVIYFKPSDSNAPVEFWVEGIGSSFGLLDRGFEPGPDHGSTLLCFQHSETYLNLTLIECFLPELPEACGVVNAAKEEQVAKKPLQLSAQPNPAGPTTLRFVTNQQKLPEACSLKIYAANGKLLKTIAAAQPEMELPAGLNLTPGFYIATLESVKTERVLAHCSFVMGQP
ncbi:MAG: hypothetical protein GC192_04690 [Bacteroidetes bacterium]|nr:hypothetical protein [Bacteroidota bacterium]